MQDKEAEVPPSITFSLMKESLCYHQDFYSSDLTDNRASRDRINQCLSKIEFELQSSYPKQRCLQCCLPVVYFVMLLLIVGGRKTFDYVFGKISVIEMGIILLLYLLLVYSCSRFANLYIKNKIKARCQLIVDEQNEILKARGLRWDLPREFPYLVDLYKDYKSASYEHKRSLKALLAKRKTTPILTTLSSPLSKSISAKLEVIPEIVPPKSSRRKTLKKKYVPFSEENNA